MSKGLKVALLTVAVGFMGFYAMAFAPVISDIPSPIVGDAEDITTPNSFVFPDAIDLDSVVRDDYTADADLRWSYEVGTPQRYSINGVDPIDSSTEDPAVPGAKAINTQVLGGEMNPDGDPATITIRDIILSPLGGSNTDPGIEWVPDEDGTPVTLYASDGSTYSMVTVLFYTHNDAEDALSSGLTPPLVIDPPGTVMRNPLPLNGTTLTIEGDAACITTALIGNNYGEWYGDYGDLELVANSVWGIRLNVTSDQATAGTVPFWDFIVDNFSQNGLSGQNGWGQDWMFLDNEGGANAPVTGGRTDFQAWFTPPQVLTDEFNDPLSGMFSDTWSMHKDARLRFRVLDVNSNPGITADNDLGKMCLTEWQITRYDIDSAQAGTTELDTTITAAEFDPTATAGAWSFDAGAETATYTPNTAAMSDLYSELWYGDSVLDYGNPSTLVNSFPVPFTANTLYEVTYELSAPTQEAEDSPPDVLFIAMDTPTNEHIAQGFFTPQMGGMGTPDLNEVTPYRFYYYSHSTTKSALGADAQCIRPRFFFINDTDNHNFPEGDTTNDGGVTVHSLRVRQVTFQ